MNESNVVTALIKAVDNASNILGYRIERILLAIPCVDVKRHSRRVNVMVKSGKVRLSDVQNGINEAIQYSPEENLELVNVGCIKYVINGISSRKLPLSFSPAKILPSHLLRPALLKPGSNSSRHAK